MNDKHRVSLDISQLKKAAEQEEILKRDLSEGSVKITVVNVDGTERSFDGEGFIGPLGGKITLSPYTH